MNPLRPVPFAEFLASLEEARYEQYAGNGVRDEGAFRTMQAHLLYLYSDMTVTQSYVTAADQTIDCVPIHQQPSLRLTGNVLAKPPERERSDATAARPDTRQDTKQHAGAGIDVDGRDVSCPDGHVPIVRTTLSSLTHFATLRDALSKYGGRINYRVDEPGLGERVVEYAQGRQWVDNIGMKSTFNVWSPRVTDRDEFSLSQLWLAGIGTGPLQTLETGWQVYPRLYNDEHPHFFIFYTSDNYKTGTCCYNMMCTAFVLTSMIITPGMRLPASTEDGAQVEFPLSYERNPADGNWWLRSGNQNIGYYPKTLFGKGLLTTHGTFVDFGGETNADKAGLSPPMGSGAWPYAGPKRAAYQRELHYLPQDGNAWVKPTLLKSETEPNHYKIELGTTLFGANSFYFGGPGGPHS